MSVSECTEVLTPYGWRRVDECSSATRTTRMAVGSSWRDVAITPEGTHPVIEVRTNLGGSFRATKGFVVADKCIENLRLGDPIKWDDLPQVERPTKSNIKAYSAGALAAARMTSHNNWGAGSGPGTYIRLDPRRYDLLQYLDVMGKLDFDEIRGRGAEVQNVITAHLPQYDPDLSEINTATAWIAGVLDYCAPDTLAVTELTRTQKFRKVLQRLGADTDGKSICCSGGDIPSHRNSEITYSPESMNAQAPEIIIGLQLMPAVPTFTLGPTRGALLGCVRV